MCSGALCPTQFASDVLLMRQGRPGCQRCYSVQEFQGRTQTQPSCASVQDRLWCRLRSCLSTTLCGRSAAWSWNQTCRSNRQAPPTSRASAPVSGGIPLAHAHDMARILEPLPRRTESMARRAEKSASLPTAPSASLAELVAALAAIFPSSPPSTPPGTAAGALCSHARSFTAHARPALPQLPPATAPLFDFDSSLTTDESVDTSFKRCEIGRAHV